ncbi:MAG: hypothetical protein ACOCV8_02200, partial [Spirochaetota bacterium]
NTFLTLIKEKIAKTAVLLYPDLYTDDLTEVMIDVIHMEEYKMDVKKTAVWNIIQYGNDEDHLKLKALYENPDTDKQIKRAIKNLFNRVGIDIEMMGEEDSETDDDNTDEEEDTTEEDSETDDEENTNTEETNSNDNNEND